MLPIECVVRGYLAGSGWRDYRATGAVCGHGLPAGLARVGAAAASRSSRPRRRRQTGHDENIDAATRRRARAAPERYAEVEAAALALYRFAADHAEARGIILADTKFEFGLDADGTLVLGDEALTPDSSRFWPADEYAPGGPQPSFDKQFVRDYCERTGGTRRRPAPSCPPRSSRARGRATSRRSSG